MKSAIKIVSLGQGDPDLLNMKTVRVLRDAEHLILRTGKHPIIQWLKDNNITYHTMDHFYEEADDFDSLNTMIANAIIQESSAHRIVYAVSDACTDTSVRKLYQLAADLPVRIETIPGVSFYDLHLSSSLQYLSGPSLQQTASYDLLSMNTYNPNNSLLITETDNQILAGQIKLFLGKFLDDEHPLYLLHGTDKVSSFPLYMLDRQSVYDHFTAVLVPGSDFLQRQKHVLEDLSSIVDILRSPDGCPWDRKQTHRSMLPYLTEEAWECVAAANAEDPDLLCEELGDLLFQIVFHASLGRDYDEFSLNEVITSACLKMIRRHPHVFSGDTDTYEDDSIADKWEKIKQNEKSQHTAIQRMDDIPTSLPSLKYASKLIGLLCSGNSQGRSKTDILSDIKKTADVIEDSALSETASSSLYGVLLLLCCELCRHSGLDAEYILHQTADRIKATFRQADISPAKDGKSLESLTFSELCVYLKHVEGEIE